MAKKDKGSKAGTRILHHGCKPATLAAKYQDEHYGKGMRVYNIGPGSGKEPKGVLHCTVCGELRLP